MGLLTDHGTAGQSTPPLAGRQAEFAAISEVMSSALRGAGRTLLVTGAAGLGKTRLLEEAAILATANGFGVHWGRCRTAGGAPPLLPWSQLSAGLVDGLEDDELAWLSDGRREALTRVVDAPPQLVWDMAREGASRFVLLDAIQALLHVACRSRPRLLLIDDAHAADEASIDVTRLLVDAVERLPLLVLVGSRIHVDGEGGTGAPPVLDALARCSQVALQPLDDESSDQLARAISPDLTNATLADVRALAAGNPHWVRELARELPAHTGPTPTASVARAVTTNRLLGLPPRDREVAAAAAILGRAVEARLLAEMLELDALDVHRSLRRLEREGLTVPAGPGTLTFEHDLLRDAVLETTDGSVLRELSVAAADAIEAKFGRVPGPHSAEVAGLLVRAGAPDVARTLEHLQHAARFATAQTAFDDAARHLTTARELLERIDAPSADVLEVLLALGDQQVRGRAPRAGRDTFEEAHALGRRTGEVVATARAAIGMARAQLRAPGYEPMAAEVIPAIEEAAAALEGSGVEAPSTRSQLLSALATCVAMSGVERPRIDLARAADREADRADSDRARVAAAQALRWSMLAPSPLAEHREVTDRIVAHADATGDPELLWAAQRWRLMDALEGSEPQEADQAVTVATELAGRIKEPYCDLLTLVWQSAVALLQGRFADVHRLVGEATALLELAPVAAGALGGQLVQLQCDEGNVDLAGIDAIIEAIPEQRVLQAVRPWLLANAGQHERARRTLLEFWGVGIDDLLGTHQELSTLALLAETALICDVDEVASGVRPHLAAHRDLAVVSGGGPVIWTGPVDAYLGACHLQVGDHDDAIATLEAAVRVCERMGGRPRLARTLHMLGLAHARRDRDGDRSTAVTHLHAGNALAAELGMPDLRARIEGDLEQLALPPAGDERPVAPVFRRDGAMWRLAWSSSDFALPDLRGLHHLHTLLSAPGTEVASLDLVSARQAGTRTTVGAAVQAGLSVRRGGDAGPAADARAMAAYRARIEVLEQRIAAAGRDTNQQRASGTDALEAEREELARHLEAATGLGGRVRRTADDSERARVNVTRNISSAIDRIEAHDPELAAHLRDHVHTGHRCTYGPRPVPDWVL